MPTDGRTDGRTPLVPASPGQLEAQPCLRAASRAEDRKKGLETSVQKLTDGYVKQVDELLKAKQDDIMKI